MDCNNVTALYVKAMCYYYQDVEDRAMQFFHHALRVDPDHSKSRLFLKVILGSSGNPRIKNIQHTLEIQTSSKEKRGR